MKTATISEAERNLRALIEAAQSGSAVVITDEGRPVARLESLAHSGDPKREEWFEELVRKGLVQPRRGPLPRWVFTTAPPKPESGASVLETLLKERQEGW